MEASQGRTTRSREWSGSLVLGTGVAVYAGVGSSAAMHRHSAVQFIRSSGSTMRIDVNDEVVEAQAAIVPADVDHSFVAPDGELVVVLVEPSGSFGRALHTFALDHVAIDLSDSAMLMSSLPCDPHAWIGWARAALAGVAELPGTSPEPLHRQEVIDATSLVFDQLSSVPRLAQIATSVGLSPRQLSRSFTDQVGMPFRRFVVWSRVRRAVLAVRDGQNLTNAAAEAGFADSAHFSRVFSAMFGIQPSGVLPFIDVVESDLVHV